MTRCVKCKREARPEHLTSDGLCVFCAPPPTWPASWLSPTQEAA